MPESKSNAEWTGDLQWVIFSRDAGIVAAHEATRDLLKRNIKFTLRAADVLRSAPVPAQMSARASATAVRGTNRLTLRQMIQQLCVARPGRSTRRFCSWRASWKVDGQMCSGVLLGQTPSRKDPGVLAVVPSDTLCDDTPSKSQLQAIVDTAVDGIITIDDRGIIETFNPAAEKIFQCRRADVIGKPISILMPQPFKAEHDGYMRRYMTTGEKRIIGIGREVVGLRRDGTTFPMFLSVGEQRLGGRSKFTGIVRDITDRKRAEAQVLLVSERVHRRLGHELHDGLGQVLTGAALYARAIETQCTQQNPEVGSQLNHLVNLISDAANQTRKLSRGLQPLTSKSDYVHALNSLRVQLNGLLAVNLEVHADELPREAHLLHANNLFRIAQEAFSNALRHSAARHIVIQSQSAGRSVRLIIKDDGKGFTRRRHDGLGLHIMDYRARLMGGRLQVESRPRRGTTITCHMDCGIITKEMGGFNP